MQGFSSNMLVDMVRTAWRYAGAARPQLFLCYGLFLVANIGLSFQPIVLAHIINTIQNGNAGSILAPLSWAALYGGLILFFWTLHGPARVIERRVSFGIYHAFVTSLYRKITEMPLRWHQDHHSGATINRLNKASRALCDFAQEQFILIEMLVRFVMSTFLLGFYSIWVLLASLAASVLIAAFIRRFDRILVSLIKTNNECLHHLNATLFDYISNIITILTLRVQGNTRTEVVHRIDAIKPSALREYVVNEWKWGVVNITLVITQISIISGYIAFHFWRHETMVVGSVVAIFQYLLIISQVFYTGAEAYGRLMQRHTDLHGVDELIADHARLQTATSGLPLVWKDIHIENLNFTHHEGEDALHHLQDIALSIRTGQKIALIGVSGSGKTTLLTLLRGLYEAQHVRLMVDDKQFETLKALADFTTLVPQDSEIFENTVLYNLTLGTDVSESLVQQALVITTFDDVIPKLPQGLATDIRERGVNLSGGQKQRLALARGLIAARDSSLLLLDEPTSSVDLQTESVIFDHMFAAFPDKAIVASVHRLHLLPRFDFIGLMQDGMMVEQGTFINLMASRGAFYRVWQHHLAQSGTTGEKDEDVLKV